MSRRFLFIICYYLLFIFTTNDCYLLVFPDRYYILRERPTAGSRSSNIMEDIPMNESAEGALLGLPESQTDLDVSLFFPSQ